MRARGPSLADAAAGHAIKTAINRLEALRPNSGIWQASDQGYRAAVDLSEDQRQTLHRIAATPGLTWQERLNRMDQAGLFDSALASALANISALTYRGGLLGPADRPGGGTVRRASSAGVVGTSDPVSLDPKVGVGRLSVLEPKQVPGVGSGAGAEAEPVWISANMEAPVPSKVADLLRGRQFANWDRYREAFWRAVASMPELVNQFSSQNRALMSRGLAPKAPESQQVPGQAEFHLHHVKRVADGGPVYDADNIKVVSPLRHQKIHHDRTP